jgi:hypothetical protein
VQAMSYTTGAPADYKCTKCGAPGCKLWRQYQTFANSIKLLCVDCSAADQSMQLVELREDGTHQHRADGWRCDQIGWLVPAVPTEDGESYWGYTSVPEPGVQWWKRLPLRAAGAVSWVLACALVNALGGRTL